MTIACNIKHDPGLEPWPRGEGIKNVTGKMDRYDLEIIDQIMGFPVAEKVKNLPTMQETWVDQVIV